MGIRIANIKTVVKPIFLRPLVNGDAKVMIDKNMDDLKDEFITNLRKFVNQVIHQNRFAGSAGHKVAHRKNGYRSFPWIRQIVAPAI